MQIEFNLNGKKKDAYPTKTFINLYYKEDKTTRPSTIALYVLFFAVVLLAMAKLFIYDIMLEVNEAKASYEYNQTILEGHLAQIKDYGEVNEQYSLYSYNYLNEDEKLCDRLDILKMLEETVFLQSTVDSVVITDDIVSLSFRGLSLEAVALLAKDIETYDIVAKVDVNTASLSATEDKSNLTTKMVITLMSQEAGGEQ